SATLASFTVPSMNDSMPATSSMTKNFRCRESTTWTHSLYNLFLLSSIKRCLLPALVRWLIFALPTCEKLWHGGPPATTSTLPISLRLCRSASITLVPASEKFFLRVSQPHGSLSTAPRTLKPASLNPWLIPPGAEKRSSRLGRLSGPEPERTGANRRSTAGRHNLDNNPYSFMDNAFFCR